MNPIKLDVTLLYGKGVKSMFTKVWPLLYRMLMLTIVISALFGVRVFTHSAEAMNQPQSVLVGLDDHANYDHIDILEDKVTRAFEHTNIIEASLNDYAIRALEAHANIRFVEKDAPTQALETVPWGVTRVFDGESNLFDTFDTTMGENIDVGVIDTGIDGTHDDLNVVGGINTMNDDPYDTDANGHGTHVAGTIAAKQNDEGLVGVAPAVNLYSIKALEDEGSGLTSDIIAGVEWAIENELDVLNMSLGSNTYSSAFEETLNTAYDEGMLLVGAAGNEGVDDDSGDNVTYPAAYDSVIAVSASTEESSGPFGSDETIADFSSTGEEVELIAPGENIESTSPGNETSVKNGTSMAAPHVAGVGALMMAANPSLSAEQIRDIMHDTAEDLSLESHEQGHGLIRGDLAVSAAYETVNTYTIEASSSEGGSISPEGQIEVDQGAEITFTFESNVGYELDQLIINDETFDAKESYTFESIDDDITIKAYYEQVPYTLSFDNTGDASIDSLTYYYDESIELPDAPEKEGHTFEGWYVDADYDETFDYDAMPDYDLTAYAKWEPNNYLIEYNETGDTTLSSSSITYDAPIDLPDAPEKEGHTFEGWYVDSDYDETFDYDTMPAYDVSLYANWEINDYEIAFKETGDKALSPSSITYGDSISLPDDPQKEGHTFEGWALDENYDEAFDYDTMPAYDISLYAKWSVNDYDITFRKTDDKILSSSTITYGDPISLPDDPIKEGHTFEGWYVDADYDEAYDYDTMPAYDVTVHPKWTVNDYEISLKIEHEDKSYTFAYGETIDIGDPSSHFFERFEGWYMDEDHTEPMTMESMPSEDIRLYAKFNPVIPYHYFYGSFMVIGGIGVLSIFKRIF